MKEYIKQMFFKGFINSRTKILAERIYEETKALGLSEPKAGSDSAVTMTWDKGEHHLDVDLYEDVSGGEITWFYRNRLTKAEHFEPQGKYQGIPDKIKEYIRLFI